MNDKEFRPLAVSYGYKSKRNKISFVDRRDVISIEGKSELIQRILRLCNGLCSLEEIIQKLGENNRQDVIEILPYLEARGIVCDSRDLYLRFHEDSSNPQQFMRDLGVNGVANIMASSRLRERDGGIPSRVPLPVQSALLDTISKRKSTRTFRPGAIQLDQLSGMLEATYGVGSNGHWSVASGGGMYPLDLFLIVPDGSQKVPRGIHRWSPEKATLTAIPARNPSLWLSKVFNAKTILENAAFIICIAADFRRQGEKYANRGYRLAMLEAGHAAQNTYLFCAEQNIGIVECCGFTDHALAKELGLAFPNEAVLTSLVIGHIGLDSPAAINDREVSDKAERLRHALVGQQKPIRTFSFLDPEIKGYVMPTFLANATYCPNLSRFTASVRKKSSAFATGSTSSEAQLKVLAEGFERYSLEQLYIDRKASAISLGEPFLDPRKLVPYSEEQFRDLHGISPFDPKKETGWVMGSRQPSGSKVWVPVELAYYATAQLKNEQKVCYQASSSGVAAHFDKRLATEIATYELIERDAFTVTWYSKRHVNAIRHSSLPSSLTDRISEWERLGYKTSVLDITLDGPPVALVIIWSRDKWPAISSGASCRPSFLEAALRAFDEAEFMAMTWHYYRPRRKMEMSEIDSTDGHGIFYLDPANAHHVQWLLESKEADKVREGYCGDLGYIEPVVVDITPKTHACGLSVVRVLSEKLMPINFGYGNEHRGHNRMKMLSFQWSEEYPSTPHFFA